MDDRASPTVQWVKNPLAVQETPEMGVLPLGQGDPPGEGPGNPLWCSCLEHPMDRRHWQATGHRIAESDMTEHLSTHTFE